MMNKKAVGWSVAAVIACLVIGFLWWHYARPDHIPPAAGPNQTQQPADSNDNGNTDTGEEPENELLPAYQTSEAVRSLMDGLTLEQKIEQMLIVDLNSLGAANGEEAAKLLKGRHYGGVILFRKDVPSLEHTVQLLHDLKEAAALPIWTAIDQEGGTVVRFPWGTKFTGNMAIGAAGDERYARETGRYIGKQLKALGFNLNFAPSLDVNNNPDNPVIGLRSFGSDPHDVARLGTAMIAGFHEAGIAATAKHFPGHGDTDVDSHLGLPTVPYDMTRLEEVELAPFKQAAADGVDMIMTAHITFPHIETATAVSKKDGSEITLPATLSPRFLTDIARKEMGYEGILVTDALNMQAIVSHFGEEEADVAAVQSGVDMLLMPPHPRQTVDNIAAAVKDGRIPEERIDESVQRILTLKEKRGLLEEPLVSVKEQLADAKAAFADKEAAAMEREIAEKAVTLLKNEGGLLPFEAARGTKLVLIAPGNAYNTVRKSIERTTAGRSFKLSGWKMSESLTKEQRNSLSAADHILIVTNNLHTDGTQRDAVVATLNSVADLGKKAAVLAVGSPYDIRYMPEASAYLAVYGVPSSANTDAGLRAVFGEIEPTGKLPVDIPDLKSRTMMFARGSGQNYSR